jgi:hypothetical protein
MGDLAKSLKGFTTAGMQGAQAVTNSPAFKMLGNISNSMGKGGVVINLRLPRPPKKKEGEQTASGEGGGEGGGSEGEESEGGGILGGIGKGIKGMFTTGLKGMGVGLSMGAGIAIMQKILSFVMSLAPIRAVMQMIGKIMTLFMLPASMVILAFLLPFLMFFMDVMKQVNLPQFMTQILTFFSGMSVYLNELFKIIQPYLPQIMKVMMLIMAGIVVGLMSPILAIVLAITGIFALIALLIPVAKIISSDIVSIVNAFKVLISSTEKMLKPLDWIWKAIVTGFTDIENVIEAINPSNIGHDITSLIPKFATGGHVYSEGIAYLHAGETVVPSSNSTSNVSNTIHVNVSGGNNIDPDQLAKQILKRIEYKTRGSVSW